MNAGRATTHDAGIRGLSDRLDRLSDGLAELSYCVELLAAELRSAGLLTDTFEVPLWTRDDDDDS